MKSKKKKTWMNFSMYLVVLNRRLLFRDTSGEINNWFGQILNPKRLTKETNEKRQLKKKRTVYSLGMTVDYFVSR